MLTLILEQFLLPHSPEVLSPFNKNIRIPDRIGSNCTSKQPFFFQGGQLRGTVLISTEMQPAGKQNYLVSADECLCFLQDISTAIRGRGDGGELRGFLFPC